MVYAYSWIVPMKDEAASLPRLIAEIAQAMEKIPAKGWEILAVNDASSDQTKDVLQKLSKRYAQLRPINFEIHQGKWGALAHGLKEAKGEIVITIDSDLQDDPWEVLKLLAKLDEGYDLVSGWRTKRHDSLYKVAISRLGNYVTSVLTGKNYKDLNSPFKLYRREVIDELPKEGSLFRFALLFAERLGNKVVEVPIRHRSRLYGTSKFGIIKYLRIVYDLLLVFLLFSGSGRLRRKKLAG